MIALLYKEQFERFRICAEHIKPNRRACLRGGKAVTGAARVAVIATREAEIAGNTESFSSSAADAIIFVEQGQAGMRMGRIGS